MLATTLIATLGYYGELLAHPGLYGGLHRDFGPVDVGATVGMYTHPQNHVGVWGRAEAAVRPTPGLRAWAGVGVLNAFAPARTVNYVNLGRPALSPAIGVSGGPRLGDVRLDVGIELFARYPVNARLVPSGALRVGVAWGTGR